MKNPRALGFEAIPDVAECAAKAVLDAAYKVHTALGAGLLESVYEACLTHELRNAGVSVDTEVVFPIIYDGVRLETGLRLDLLVNRVLIVEVKSVEQLIPVHTSQLITYLKLTGLRLGLLINFNVPHLRDGIKRIVY